MSESIWRFYLFGRLQAQSEHKTLNRLSMRRIGALLACLTIRAPHPVPREELLDLLWPEAPADASRNRLSVLLNALRKQLEPGNLPPASVLLADRQSIQIVPSAFTSDYHDFLHVFHDAGAASSESDRVAQLERAVNLYQGELLTGYYDDWIITERRRLAGMRYRALRDLARRLTQIHAPERAIDYAQRAVAAEPFDEEAHCDLIRLLDAIGQPSAALRQFEQLKRLLLEETQTLPSPNTLLLAAQIEQRMGHGIGKIKRTVRPMMPRANERKGACQRPPDTLPPRLTRFFGREEEIVVLRALLSPGGSIRLVTLLGPGGAGKTRLAVETGETLKSEYDGRVYFAVLADISDSSHIGSVVAKALRLPPSLGVDPISQAIDVLNLEPSLLILDNMEQILPEASPQIEHLLHEVPTLRCLLTSRRSAGIEGEQEFPLGPLPTPEAGVSREQASACAGVALFLDRVQSIRPDFALTSRNTDDVVHLCRALEGLPLALELAAARARVMTPGEMRRQTDKLLTWLVDVRGGKNARHRSLRATLEWSYRLLTLEERRFFSALSVFSGGFSAEAAACVGVGDKTTQTEALALLERLCAASLLTILETEEATTRFGMLEPLREFGLERLAEMGMEMKVRRSHLDYFAGTYWEQGMPASQWDAKALSYVAADDANMREALEFGLREGAEPKDCRLAFVLAGLLADYWEMQGNWTEGRRYLHRVAMLQEAGERPGCRVKRFHRAGALSNLLGDYREGISLSLQGLAFAKSARDRAGMAGCICNLGHAAFYQDNYEDARMHFEEALELYQQVEDETNIAACQVSLGNVAFFLGDHQKAETCLRQALETYRRTADRYGTAASLLRLGNVRRNLCFFDEGRAHLNEALEIFQEIGHRQGAASSLYGLAVAALYQSRYEEAHARFAHALEIFRGLGFRRGIGTCLGNLGSIAQNQGDYSSATACYAEAMGIYHSIKDRRSLAACLIELGFTALETGDYATADLRFQETRRIYEEINSPGGIAHCLIGLSHAALDQERVADAHRLLSEAEAIYRDMSLPSETTVLLEALALFSFRTGEPAFASRIAGAAHGLRGRFGHSRSLTPRRWRAALDTLRADLGEAAFQLAWRQGESLSGEQAVAEARQILKLFAQ